MVSLNQATAISTASDAELIARVRGGDTHAYGLLFARHRDAATRLARQLAAGGDADDLVAEAFAKLLPLLRAGGGPDLAFRAYLLTTVRRLHVDRLRSGSRLQTTGDMAPFDRGVPFTDTAVTGFERSAAAKAFASLPERWQTVLWHCEVEGSKPAEIAPLLGMSPNSVAALAYRAREGLRQAYLRNHLADVANKGCRWTTERLGAFVRGGLSRRDHAKVEQHIEECRRCAAVYLELAEVNSNLRGILGPWLLGAAATGYLASSGKAGAASLSWWTRTSHAGSSPRGVVAAAGVAVTAVIGAAVFMQGGPQPQTSIADGPAARPLISADRPPDLGLKPLTLSIPEGLGTSHAAATVDELQLHRPEVTDRLTPRQPSVATTPGGGDGNRTDAGGGGGGGGTNPGGGGGGTSNPGGGGSGATNPGGGPPPQQPKPDKPKKQHGPSHTPRTDPQPDHGNDDEHGHKGKPHPKKKKH